MLGRLVCPTGCWTKPSPSGFALILVFIFRVAKIRVIVKRILGKWGYPPDLQEEAVKTVLMQAELLCKEWA